MEGSAPARDLRRPGSGRVARLATIGWTTARISASVFGSGNATTALLGREFIERRRWLTPDQFSTCFALARATPGTNLLGFCTGMGWILEGWAGALVCLAAASLPAALVVVVLTGAYLSLGGTPWGAFTFGLAMAAIVGVIGAGAWLLVRQHIASGRRLRTFTIVSAAAILSALYETAPIRIIALAAIVGYFWPEREAL